MKHFNLPLHFMFLRDYILPREFELSDPFFGRSLEDESFLLEQLELVIEQAASLGVGLSTAAMGICHKLHIPINLEQDPGDHEGAGQAVFIHGGSTATGTMSIQLARL